MTPADLAMFGVIALAVGGVLCVLSGLVQILADDLHQRAKRRRKSGGDQ